MTRNKLLVFVFAIVASLLPGAAIGAPGIVQDVPTEGLALLVMSEDLSAQELVDALEGDGCNVESIFIFDNSNGEFLSYVPGGPQFVNAPFLKEDLVQYTPFFVRCAAPKQVKRTGQADRITPVQGEDVPLRYECGQAVFEITNWYLPENLTDQWQQGDVFVTYKVPANGTVYSISVHLRILDGNRQDLVPLGWSISSSFVTSSKETPFGVKDNQFHKADARIYPVLTEGEVDRGAPHFTAFPKGEHFSDTRPFPFFIGTPPVIWGYWSVGDRWWLIDTGKQEYCGTNAVGESINGFLPSLLRVVGK